MDSKVRILYLKYLQQGLSPQEAAKMVQKTTGLNARTGKPLKKKEDSLYNTTYIGQYGKVK